MWCSRFNTERAREREGEREEGRKGEGREGMRKRREGGKKGQREREKHRRIQFLGQVNIQKLEQSSYYSDEPITEFSYLSSSVPLANMLPGC